MAIKLLQVKISEEDNKKLKEISESMGISISALVRMTLKEMLNKHN